MVASRIPNIHDTTLGLVTGERWETVTSMDVPESLMGRLARTKGVSEQSDAESLRRLVVEKLTYATGRDPLIAGERDWFVAAALALRDRIVDRWLSGARSDAA